MVRGFAPVPTTALLSDFCHKKVVGRLPAALRAPLSDNVVRLEVLEGGSEPGWVGTFVDYCPTCQDACQLVLSVWLLLDSCSLTAGLSSVPCCGIRLPFATACCAMLRHAATLPRAPRSLPPHAHAGCRVHLASGRTLLCRAAVYTPANRRPVLPAWARPLLGAPAAAEPGNCNEQQGGGSNKSSLQLPPGILTADGVNLSTAAGLEGKQLVVIGGGMSAGLLAAGAAERGAHVHLVCRRCACRGSYRDIMSCLHCRCI